MVARPPKPAPDRAEAGHDAGHDAALGGMLLVESPDAGPSDELLGASDASRSSGSPPATPDAGRDR